MGTRNIKSLGTYFTVFSWKIYDCLCLAWYLNKTNYKYWNYAIKVGWTSTRTKQLHVLKKLHKPCIINSLHTVCLCIHKSASVIIWIKNWCDEKSGQVSEKPELYWNSIGIGISVFHVSYNANTGFESNKPYIVAS